jgi:murein DD-endopeptidase MepM/ murein hydrolase activator NlpD
MKNIVKILMVIIITLCANNVLGQEVLADNAPINKTIKNIDSLLIQKVNTIEDIYENTWTTTTLFSYKNLQMPDKYKIDLRHFSMPIPQKKYTKVTSKFGYRPQFGRMHYGVDLKVYTGDTIYSAFDGKVRLKKYDANGYGYYIVIRHKNGLETLYAHLSKQLVNINQEVKSGQPIGLGGNTGRSFGSHLHFETRILGKAINPELLFDFNMRDVTQDYYVYTNEKIKTKHNQMVAILPKREEKHYYKIKQGDTLDKIAKKLGVNTQTLCKLNHITINKKLKPGQLLKY